jgi:hypothetical protein
MTAPLAVADRNVVFGAYGSATAARPVLSRTLGNGPSIISLWTNCVDVSISDITFDSPYPTVNNLASKMSVDAIVAGGTNVTVSDCEFLNVNNAINANRRPSGLLVQDSTAPLATGLRSYFVWGEGTDHVYLNNKVANSTREHVVRMVDVTRLLIAGNDFANTDRRSVDYEDYSKGSIEMHRGSYHYVTGNTIRDGTLRAGPRGGETEDASTKTEWVVIESNTVLNVSIQVRPGAHHVMIRNNVINNEGAEAIMLYKPDVYGRVSSDVTIDNNTAVNHESTGRFLHLEGRVDGVTLTHNLFVAPNITPGSGSTSGVYVGMNDLSAFRTISGNVWPSVTGIGVGKGGINYVGATYAVAADYRDPTEWEAFEQVEGDEFRNVAESAIYSVSVGTQTVGSTLRLAA